MTPTNQNAAGPISISVLYGQEEGAFGAFLATKDRALEEMNEALDRRMQEATATALTWGC